MEGVFVTFPATRLRKGSDECGAEGRKGEEGPWYTWIRTLSGVPKLSPKVNAKVGGGLCTFGAMALRPGSPKSTADVPTIITSAIRS